MEKSDFQSKWYYRLLKVIFYLLYWISLLINIWTIFAIIWDLYLWFDTGSIWSLEDLIYWFTWLPIIILFFELLRTTFYYIVIWKWNFRLNNKLEKYYYKILFYFNYKWRLWRLNFFLSYIIINIIFWIFGKILDIFEQSNNTILVWILVLTYLWLIICLLIKRINDLDWKKWHILFLIFIPVIFVLLFKRWTIWNNKNWIDPIN